MSRNKRTATMMNALFKTLRNKIKENKLTDDDLKKLNSCITRCISNRKIKNPPGSLKQISEIVETGASLKKSRSQIIQDIMNKYTMRNTHGMDIPSPPNSKGKKSKRKKKKSKKQSKKQSKKKGGRRKRRTMKKRRRRR